MTDVDRDRRRDLAKQALVNEGMELGLKDGDPYWLCNMHGRTNTDDAREMAEKMAEDAELLREVADRIDEGELLSEEGAIVIARESNYGEYSVHSWLDQEMPITEEP